MINYYMLELFMTTEDYFKIGLFKKGTGKKDQYDANPGCMMQIKPKSRCKIS